VRPSGFQGEEHADFEPLLLAVGQRPGAPLAFGGKTDGSEDLIDAPALSRGGAPRRSFANS